ncbi:MAG: hypothetical protein K8R48_06005 [Alphaproteobacteria bacterium]|nr:hypothetical protein [Alphaproteobacteria bacterium]
MSTLAFVPAQADYAGNMQANGARTHGNYEKYMAAARGSDPFSEHFELDETMFNQVQGLFDGYVRKRIARAGLRHYADTDIIVAGSQWRLDQWLTYLLQQGTKLGAEMSAMEAGFSREAADKVLNSYGEDEYRFAEDFWKLTGRLMVAHAKDYYNIRGGQLTPILVHTQFDVYYGDYYNPRFMDINIFLDQALRNYQISSVSAGDR